jgi:hypothetical protein
MRASLHGLERGCTVAVVIDREALRTQALRIHGRYAREVVEGLGLCPWAMPARNEGRVRTLVVFGAEPDLEQALREVEALTAEKTVDIGLLVFPELTRGRLDFQHFAARVRERCDRPEARWADGFALADFHPDAAPDLDSAARLVPFLRRSPDPTLQLIRHSALRATHADNTRGGTRFVDVGTLALSNLAALREPGEPLHARLARANLETVRRLGIEQVAAMLEDILHDRDLSYARLGLAPPVWSRLRHMSIQT